jgi:hypothetical protein
MVKRTVNLEGNPTTSRRTHRRVEDSRAEEQTIRGRFTMKSNCPFCEKIFDPWGVSRNENQDLTNLAQHLAKEHPYAGKLLVNILIAFWEQKP